MILAHQFEKIMQKIIRIAPLIIALILGTCYSSQAQIVTVQPNHIDGGFSTFHGNHAKNQQKPADNNLKSTISSDADSELKLAKYPDLNTDNSYYIIEYEVRYSICSYNKNRQTDLQSGSYYCKLVGCKFNNESVSKDLN